MFIRTGLLGTAVAAVLVILTAIGGHVPHTAHAGASSDPEQILDAAAARFAAGDLAGTLSYYAEDAVLTDIDVESGRSFHAVGNAAVGAVLGQGIADQLEVVETGRTVEGDVVSTTAEWSDAVSTAAGVSRYLVTTTVLIPGDKIERFEVTYDQTDAETRTYLAYAAAQPLVPPPGTVTFPIGAGSDASQPGDGYLAPAGPVTFVFLAVAPGPTGELQSAFLQSGACPASGSVVWSLAPVLNGFSLTAVSAPLEELTSGTLAVHVQQTAGLSTLDVACGDVSDAVLLPAEPAPAPTAQPVAAVPPPAPIGAPNTGGGMDESRSPHSLVLLTLLVLGVGTVVASATMRKRR